MRIIFLTSVFLAVSITEGQDDGGKYHKMVTVTSWNYMQWVCPFTSHLPKVS